MNSIMGVVVVLIVLNILFLVTGKSFFCLFKREETIEFEWLTGFVLFLAVFGVIELPIEMSGLPFHVLVYAESAVFAVLFAGCILYCIYESHYHGVLLWKKPDRRFAMLLVMLFLLILYGMNNGASVHGYDTSYYNGHAANALYTDTMYQYDARTGLYKGNESYVHDCYPMLIATLAKIFFMHTLVVVNRVLACVEILFASLIVYETARRLAGGREDIANWTVGIHGALSILSYECPDTAEYYLWQRKAASQSMLCNIYLPFVLLALVLLAKEIDNKCNWLILGMIVTAGMAMSVSGIFIIAAMVGIGVVVIMTVQKKWKYMINTMLCMMPGMMIGMIRILQ